jgi:hypothetical protein
MQDDQLNTELVQDEVTVTAEEGALNSAEAEGAPEATPVAEDVKNLKKRLADNQAAFTRSQMELAEFRRKQHAQHVDKVASEIDPDIVETVKKANYVIESQREQDSNAAFARAEQAVAQVFPEWDALSSDAKFQEEFGKRSQRMNINDPIEVIKVVRESRDAILQNQGGDRQAAEKAYRLASMSVPGKSSGGKSSSTDDLSADAVANMSKADFEKLQRKALGY